MVKHFVVFVDGSASKFSTLGYWFVRHHCNRWNFICLLTALSGIEILTRKLPAREKNKHENTNKFILSAGAGDDDTTTVEYFDFISHSFSTVF